MDDTKPTPRAGRKRGIPPAPPQRKAFGVLATGEDVLALALYSSLKNVVMWAHTPPNRRPALFRRVGDPVRERMQSAASAAPLLADPLSVFLDLHAAPGEMEPARVGLACFRVWQWAERCGLLEVATHFAEAGAYADPTNPKWAAAAGYTARQVGGPEMWMRSEVWHLRALALAVRAGNRYEVVRALTGWGALLKDMDRPDEALEKYEEAARRAVRAGQRRAAIVQHYMFALCVDYRRFDEAARHAVRAFDLYPAKDERLPFLAHDLAFMLVRLRYYRLALHLLDVAVTHMGRPHEMGLLFGTTAEAAGCVGRAARYAAAERATLELVNLGGEHTAAAFARLASGARALRDWERAEGHARASVACAKRRGDKEQARESLALLESILARESGPVPESPPEGAPVAMLARRFAARLRHASRRVARV